MTQRSIKRLLLIGGGHSHVEVLRQLGNNPIDNADVTLEERLRKAAISIYFVQLGGDASGLGSISDTRRAGFNVRFDSKRATLFMDVSAFDTKGTLDNVYDTRGAAVSASVGLPLNRTFSLNAGAQYQRYDHTADFGFEQKRLFVSLRMETPAFWRFAR